MELRPPAPRRAREFAAEERGMVAVMFAAAMLVIAPLMLGLVDMHLASSQRARLQDALDAATLFAARSSEHTDAGVQAVGLAALEANLKAMGDDTLVEAEFRLEEARVIAWARAQPAALAAGLFGQGHVRADAEVLRSMDKLEVALVLDNTGSMSGQKLSTLKVAGKDLVDRLAAAAERSTEADAIKIALVPFSMTVRVADDVSLSGYNTSTRSGPGVPDWIDPRGMAHFEHGKKYEIFNAAKTDRLAVLKSMDGDQPWAGCVEQRRQPEDIQDNAPTSSNWKTMFTPYFWPDEPDASDGFWGYANDYLDDQTNSSKWKNRQRHHNKYAGERPRWGSNSLGYDYGPNAGCELQPIIPLTTDLDEVKAAIEDMNAVGETNIPMGLAWGWYALSPGEPLTQGAAYGTEHLRKIVILMTDGDNTFSNPSWGEQNSSYYGGLGYIWQDVLGTTTSSSSARREVMDDRLALLCENIKAEDIQIYTVRVEVHGGSSGLLEGCATEPDMFYDVQDVADLGAAFDAIAGAIDNLRLSR